MGVPIALGFKEDAASGAQVIDGGLRFDSSKSQRLTRTPSIAGNQKTWTWSGWAKRGTLGSNQLLFGSSTFWTELFFNSSNQLQFYAEGGSVPAGGLYLYSNAVFRDTSAWMHVVWVVDTTQSITANRIKVYVNGVELTWTSSLSFNQNLDLGVNATNVHGIGSRVAENNLYLNSFLSNVYFIDGQALDPSYFGYTDPLTNTWRPKKYNSSLRKLNDGTTWNSTYTDAFQGYVMTDSATVGSFTGLNGSITITLSSSVVVTSSLRLNLYANVASFATYTTVSINGTSQTGNMTLIQSTGTNSGIWEVSGFSGTLSSITLGAQNVANNGISRVIVDGVTLINGINDPNSFGRNGFYLPMDGNSPIGQDRSGRGNNWTPVNFGGSNTLEKATGALPILNTDGGGKVARVGVRTDTTIGVGATCVLALPLVGIKSDFSNQVDSRSTQKTVTVTGAVGVSTQSNFYGGSFYFNGSSRVTVNTSTDLDLSGDFTIEGWFYRLTDTSAYPPIWNTSASGGFTAETTLVFNASAANKLDFYADSTRIVSTSTVTTNTWYHFSVTRSGSTTRMFLNGILQESSSTSYTVRTGQNHYLGDRPAGAVSVNYPFNGYIQDFRIYKGTAKYTQNFIPASTDPDILPDTPSGVAYSSNVALVPSTDGAVAFDGTGDKLTLASNTDFQFGTGDFTVEAFVYKDSADGDAAIFDLGSTNTSGSFAIFWNAGTLTVRIDGLGNDLSTTETPSNKWIHVAVARSGSTLRLFIDGDLKASGTRSNNITQSTPYIGDLNLFDYDFTGFISNLHVVKGTALYTANFTPPTAPITSVANTKLLCCKSNSSATASDVTPGTITANGNAAASNFNPFTVNINTQRGQESGYCTLNPLDNAGTLSNGNLDFTYASAAFRNVRATLAISSGKWYWEGTLNAIGGAAYIGIGKATASLTVNIGGTDTWGYVNSGNKQSGNTAEVSYGSSYTTSDVIGVLFDADAGTLTFYKNGVSQGQAYSGLTSGPYFLMVTAYNGTIWATNFGQKPFKFPPPAGFQPLALANTPRPTIVRPDQYVGIVTYTGTASVQSITGVGNFKPDFVWIKDRGVGWNHQLYDSVRGVGANKELTTSQTWREGDTTNMNTGAYGYVSSLDASGFTLNPGSGGAGQYVNQSTKPYVAWCWKAGGNSNTFNINDIGYSTASAAGLTAGTITPTGASVNTKSGFSIITWTSDGASSIQSLSHGMNATPAFIIAKNRSISGKWWVWHKSFNNQVRDYLDLQLTDATTTAGVDVWSTSSTTFGMRQATIANNTNLCVAYLWAEIPGFSKFGSYTGNGSSDGPMVVTGFKVRWLMIKRTDSTSNWYIIDASRSPYNEVNDLLYAEQSLAETVDDGNNGIDFLSNGFKLRKGVGGTNVNASTLIYAAFAESPSFNLYGGQSNAR